MSSKFDGMRAARNGIAKEQCPYASDSEKGREWLAGWMFVYEKVIQPVKERDAKKGRHASRYKDM